MIHFEDIYKENSVLINTLQEHEQGCLIHNTIPANQEIHIMNTYLKTNKKVRIIIYGKNYGDKSIIKKFNQLKKLGFSNVFIILVECLNGLCYKKYMVMIILKQMEQH